MNIYRIYTYSNWPTDCDYEWWWLELILGFCALSFVQSFLLSGELYRSFYPVLFHLELYCLSFDLRLLWFLQTLLVHKQEHPIYYLTFYWWQSNHLSISTSESNILFTCDIVCTFALIMIMLVSYIPVTWP
jgi:hypothetical protein